MLMSAISRAVNSTAKMQNVVCTYPALMSDIAMLFDIRSWIIQGCLPTSATTHPLTLQIYVRGMDMIARR